MTVRRRSKKYRGSGRSGGFTLIEISVVMAIIGVLSSITGVQYLQMLHRARVARAIVELRGIAAELDLMGDDDSVFPTSLADVGISRLDPWGQPYQYLLIDGQLPPGMTAVDRALPHVAAPGGGGGKPAIALARKDRFLVPINSDYDLYSVGPDGETHATLNNPVSRDDIIRAADGAFYGLAEKF